MAKLPFTLTLLSLLFAFALARSPSDENDVGFLDQSSSRAEFDAKPTLLLPSQRSINEAEETDKKPFPIDNGGLIAGETLIDNGGLTAGETLIDNGGLTAGETLIDNGGIIAGETGAEVREKAVEVENEGVGAEEEDQRRNDDEVAEEEDQKPVDDEKDDVVEAEQEDLKRPVAVARFWPEHGHFRRPCHHWMKRLMRMRAMRHRMDGRPMPYGDKLGEFHGKERRETEEEEHKPLELESDGVAAAEENQKKATEPETQILDLSGPMTVVRFPLVNRHFHGGCRHHWLKHMLKMRHHMHGGEMPYGRDMILGGGERKAFDRDFFHDVERKEADPEMGQFRDGERKEIDMRTFPTDEGEVREMHPQWIGYHHHHHDDHDHHHDDHEGRPWFPFFGRHHHHDHDDHDDHDHHHDDHEGRPWFPFFGRHHHHDHHHHDDHEGRPWFPISGKHHHHDHERFSRQSSGRPFFRHEEEEREEGGFLDRIRNFFTDLF